MPSVKRFAVAGLTVAALTATPWVATAATTTPTSPGIGQRPIDCDPNQDFYLAEGGRREVVTHREGFHMVAHQTKTITKRTRVVKVLKTDVEVDGNAKISGSKITKILLTAEASVHGHFAKMSETTEEHELTVTDKIQTNKKEGDYVAFAGYRSFSGWWKHMQCGSDGVTKTLIDQGYWESFDPIYKDGFALCPSTRYPSSSLMAQACVDSWE